ncbi:gibberellin 20 oxidase 1-b [Phtheirospermum japonicum]|uniref:Gibberellin 20 oxidase 1-b n=1 Tax=Phtheirospermum japonicum TaxID=374723 RepID=A0A830DGW6_9LAMI|nr:gibberellin 20 oxidase 1-b [Phtheirospermum japonicum]
MLSYLKKPNFPTQFLWPHEGLASAAGADKLEDPPIDLNGFLNGDEEATRLAAARIRTASLKYGFFQVVNHGVDASLTRAVQQHMDAFFNLPLNTKLATAKKPAYLCGYSGAHADRFLSKLPWKETFSFVHEYASDDVVSHVKSVLGQDFEEAGLIYQKYCEAMKELSLAILELLAMILGVERLHYRKFFEDGSSIMRGNHYPPCKEAGLTLGTGPHCDPTSLTTLHQDQVSGLQIFFDGKW